jgi:hypothetical protein
MKKNLWFVILFLGTGCLPQGLSAQNNQESVAPGEPPAVYVPGYVILTNGDTLKGKLKWSLKYVENNPVEIKFTAENGNTKIFPAGEIRGFGNMLKIWMDNDPRPIFTDMEHYLTMPSMKKGVPVFMDRMLDGRIRVFLNRGAIGIGGTTVTTEEKYDGIAFSFSSDKGLSIGPTYTTNYKVIKSRSRYTSYLVSKDNGALVKVDKDDYGTHIKDLFGDCPAINDEITKNPDLALFKNFMLLAEVYNMLCAK